MIDPEVAMDKLSSFDTADEIAEFLIGEGIVGRQQNGSKCPVAQYITRESGIGVAIGSVMWYREDSVFGGYFRGDAISKFVRSFDMGSYPELRDQCK